MVHAASIDAGLQRSVFAARLQESPPPNSPLILVFGSPKKYDDQFFSRPSTIPLKVDLSIF
jgi:hypothetical protein